MTKVLVTESHLEDIADAIRERNGGSATYKPGQMAAAIEALPNVYEAGDEGKVVSEGGLVGQTTRNVTANGTYDTTTNDSTVVDVPNTYAAGDEGKVVSNGVLVAQTTRNVSANGTYDTTENDSTVVNVPNTYAAGDEGKVVDNGALVAQTARESTITVNGVYDTTNNNSVEVAVSGGSTPTLITKSIGANGTYNASDDNADGYSQVVANVPNTYAAGDEGKVVSGGTLVAQTARSSEITENGTYDTTTNDSVTVNIGNNGIYTGIGEPSWSLGNNGDLYVRSYPLPDNVVFASYLESSGTQWIETNLTGDLNTRMYAEFFFTTSPVCTARYSANSQTLGIGYVSGGLLSLDFGTQRAQIEAVDSLFYSCSVGQGYCDVNGDIIAARNESAFTTPTTFRLFAINAANSYGFVTANNAKIRRVTIFKYGLPVVDYLAAKDGNNVACMYEAISGNYIYNSGSGNFIYGGGMLTKPKETQVIYKKINGYWCILNQMGAV